MFGDVLHTMCRLGLHRQYGTDRPPCIARDGLWSVHARMGGASVINDDVFPSFSGCKIGKSVAHLCIRAG